MSMNNMYRYVPLYTTVRIKYTEPNVKNRGTTGLDEESLDLN